MDCILAIAPPIAPPIGPPIAGLAVTGFMVGRFEMAKEEFGSQAVYLAVVHARDPKSGEELLAEAQQHFNHKETMIGELSISVAANLGPGTVGLVV